MATTKRRLSVTVTAYEGDVGFPEAESYPEFVSARLAEMFGAEVETSVGLKTQVFAYGFGAEESDVVRDAESAVKVDFWEEFCAEGYKQFTA